LSRAAPQHGDDELVNPVENTAQDTTPDTASAEAGELAHRIVEVASDKKAVDIVMLRTAEVTTMADYFVICSGRSERQVSALSQAIIDQLREDGVRPLGVEGLGGARWVLIDLGAVIVHVFAPEEREYYGLERLWSNAAQVVRVV
jgi:ribosome-associated protein